MAEFVNDLCVNAALIFVVYDLSGQARAGNSLALDFSDLSLTFALLLIFMFLN